MWCCDEPPAGWELPGVRRSGISNTPRAVPSRSYPQSTATGGITAFWTPRTSPERVINSEHDPATAGQRQRSRGMEAKWNICMNPKTSASLQLESETRTRCRLGKRRFCVLAKRGLPIHCVIHLFSAATSCRRTRGEHEAPLKNSQAVLLVLR